MKVALRRYAVLFDVDGVLLADAGRIHVGSFLGL